MRKTRTWLGRRFWGRLLLAALARVYAIGIWVHRISLAARSPAPRLPHRVISVGNLTAGGTGKTSMTAYISRNLLAQGGSVCVLARGYKGADEARLLEIEMEEFNGRFSVRTGPDRLSSARDYLKELDGVRSSGLIFVLDDGHQHRGLFKNFSLVLINAMTLEELCGLLPLGLLREPFEEGLARADAAVLTHADLASEAALGALENRLAMARPGLEIFRAAHAPHRLRKVWPGPSRSQPLESLAGTPVALVSGLGSPEAFSETVSRRLSCPIARHWVFEDHHAYTREQWLRLLRDSAASGAGALVTSAKDWIRLGPAAEAEEPVDHALPLYVLDIRLRLLDREQEFWKLIHGRIQVPA